MTIHTDLAARHVQKLAASNGDGAGRKTNGTIPYVLAGDWNIKPDGSSYRLLTTGKMDKGECSRTDRYVQNGSFVLYVQLTLNKSVSF